MTEAYLLVGMLGLLLVVACLVRVVGVVVDARRRRRLDKFWTEFFAEQDRVWQERHG